MKDAPPTLVDRLRQRARTIADALVREGARWRHRRLRAEPHRSDPYFVPILGYLDDLIIVPAGIALAVKMIPEPVPAVIVGIWLVAAGFVLWLAHDAIS